MLLMLTRQGLTRYMDSFYIRHWWGKTADHVFPSKENWHSIRDAGRERGAALARGAGMGCAALLLGRPPARR